MTSYGDCNNVPRHHLPRPTSAAKQFWPCAPPSLWAECSRLGSPRFITSAKPVSHTWILKKEGHNMIDQSAKLDFFRVRDATSSIANPLQRLQSERRFKFWISVWLATHWCAILSCSRYYELSKYGFKIEIGAGIPEKLWTKDWFFLLKLHAHLRSQVAGARAPPAADIVIDNSSATANLNELSSSIATSSNSKW